MSSGDFNLLHLRNLKMYNPDGSHPAVSSIFTMGQNGVPVYTSSIALGAVSASTITASTVSVSAQLGVSSLVGSTLSANSGTISTLNASTLTSGTLSVSTLSASALSASTLSASTVSSNLLTTLDINLQSTQIALGLSTTSTQVNFSQGSYASSSWLTAKSGLTNPRKLGTSSTGQYQLVVSGNTADLWLSSDSGVTWSQLTPASTGLPTLSGSAYWSSGSISANGQYILLSVYGGSLWMSQDYGRTFATTAQPTPDIWLQLNGNLNDAMGGAAATPYGSPSYVTVQQPGFAEQAINLANTAGSAATQYARGNWSGATNFTVSGWFNPQTVNGTFQVVYSSHSKATEIYINNSNQIVGQFPLGYGVGYIGINTSFAAIANTWYYFTLIYQTNGLCSFYLNNNLIGTITNSGGLGSFPSSGYYALGIFDDGTIGYNAFNGYVCDLRIHNSAIPYVSIPHLQPNIWLPFENSTMDCGSQSANAQGSTIYLPFEGSFTDQMGVSTVTAPGTAPSYVAANRAGYSGQAINLANTAGSTATQYLRGTWTPPTNFTVSMWVNFQSLSQNQTFFSGIGTGVHIVLFDTNYLYCYLPSGTGLNRISLNTSYTLSSNTWYYITVIFQSNGTCSLYVNNSLAQTTSNSGGWGSYTGTEFTLGTYDTATTFAFNGYLDDFRLSNYAISYNPVSIQTVTGSLSYVPGVVGLNAVRLANTAGSTATNYIRESWTSSSIYTVSGWFNVQSYATNGNNQFIFSTGGTTGFSAVLLYIRANTNDIVLQIPAVNPTTISIIVPNSISLNTWYHFAIIIRPSGSLCELYINGTLYSATATATGTASGSFGLGTFDASGSNTNALNGYIDDFRIYNAAIPIHQLLPQNYRAVALSGNAQYALASAASGWVVGSSTSGQTWSKQAVCVGTQSDLIQPNKSGLAQNSWEKDGVNWTVSASSVLGIYTAYGLFDNVYPAGAPNTQWASASTYSSGNYTGSVSTTVQGGIGTVLGEWFQLQVSAPLILQSYRYATQDIQNTPKIYYIVGSNDGSTWFPIHYMSMIANPFTGSSKTLASNIIINHTGVQSIIVDVAGAGSTTSYPTSTTPYLYFRVIITTLLSIGTNAVYSEFLPNFAKPSPSQLALNYSGQYQMVATGPAAGCVMPNQTGLTTATWVQGGVQWGSSESSQTGSNPGYLAFNNTSTTGSGWATLSTKYNLTTGVYIASISTTILGGVGAQAGEWLQIQSSVPMVLQSYTFSVAESFPRFPKVFYIVGSMDGSNWYPLQYASLASNPFTVTNSTASTYLSINTTGSQTLTAGASATVTTTSYSTSTSPYMYFRIIVQNIFASNDGLVQIGEWYLNFQNSLSYSSNYGATWSNQSNVITNEIAAISPSGQYALSTNCVPPLARLTMDGTNVDSQGVLVPATGAGTVTYSSSIVKVGSHSAYFNNTAGSSPSVYLNYTVPAVLNTPSALTMACWVYPTALPASNTSIPIAFNNSANTTTAAQQIIIQTSGVVLFNYVTSVTSGNITLPAITLNSWTHYTMTYSGGTCSVFVNGVFNTSVTPGGNLALTTANANMERLIIGANLSNINAFAGYVDDVRLYTSALSAHEVAALYSNPALTQAVGVSSSYLPITSYSKPALPGATANVVDAKVSQTGQYMVAVTAANTNNVYYSTDSGSTFNALTVNGYTQAGATTPLARLPFDNSNGDVLGALTPATGAGSITYSTSIKKVGTHSAFFNNTVNISPTTYLNYTLPSVLNKPTALTIACWIYPLALGDYNAIIGLNINTTARGHALYITPTAIEFHWATANNFGGSAFFVASTVPINQWSHIVMTYQSGLMLLYLNGVLIGTDTRPTGPLVMFGTNGDLTNLFVGARAVNSTDPFNGYIDDVRLYTSALGATEVNALYAGTYDSLYTVAPMAACSISHDGSYLTVANTAGTVYTLNRNANTYTLALGNQAGQINQASNAIAIGNQAGQTNQAANSIVLNASGSALNATAPGFYVAPIADTAGLPMNLLGYGADSQIVKSGVTVLPGGLVGINAPNTNAIQAPLHVFGNNQGYTLSNPISPALLIGTTTSTAGRLYLNAHYSPASAYGVIQFSDYFFGLDHGSNLSLNPLGGNVGIGTTAPEMPLHVYTNTENACIRFNNIFNSSTGSISIATTTSAGNFITDGTNNAGVIISGNDLFLNRKTDLSTAVVIKGGTGNVGIGTANPSYTLSAWAPSNTISFYAASRNTGNTATQDFSIANVCSGTLSSSYSALQASLSFVGYNALCLNANGGNVGIGVTNPAATLQVSGSVFINLPANSLYRAEFSIGSGGNLELLTSVVGSFYTNFTPNVDNVMSLGSSSKRWTAVYAANGTIQTSDSKEKDSQPLPYGLNEILQMRTIKYKWKSQADLPDDNPAKNFEYYGFCADELGPLFPELVYDEDKSAPVQMNYTEILPVVVNALKEEHASVVALKATVDSLQANLATTKEQLNNKSAQLDALLAWAQTQGFAPVAPSEPAPSEPAPSEPAPSEPAPSEPAPSEPAPSEPAPSEPAAPSS